MRYILKCRHSRFEQGRLIRYAIGDSVELSSDEARKFGGYIVPAGAGVPDRGVDAVLAQPAPKIREFVAGTSDGYLLASLKEAEYADKKRVTVIAAIKMKEVELAGARDAEAQAGAEDDEAAEPEAESEES